MQLWSADNAALIITRAILCREPKISLQIFLGGACPKDAVSVPDIWEIAIDSLKLKYKRLGVAFDQANHEENEFLQNACNFSLPIKYELLSDFANRQLADTVEFRRLARKYLRPAKHAHCDAVLFLSGTLAEESSRKILAKTLGTQIKSFLLTDFLPKSWLVAEKKQHIEIFANNNLEQVRKEAEILLHKKITKDCVQLRKQD